MFEIKMTADEIIEGLRSTYGKEFTAPDVRGFCAANDIAYQTVTKKIKQLVMATKDIMERSYISGGAELKDFNNPFNTSIFKLKVYGKKKDEFGNIVKSIKTSDQRKSWYCPKVQK